MEGKIEEQEKSNATSQTEEQVENGSPDFLEDCAPREKKLMRKVDRRLIPILGALYSIALVDRVNIAQARIAGMDEELELSIGSRYSIALLVFFIPYFIFELPSNLVLRRVGSANWLAFIALSWGTFMLATGFITNYQSLVVFRLMLGLFEAGFFPACVYLISCWYVRYEVQMRLALFYLVAVTIGSFSSILAFGLMKMEGILGYRGWRWIFIVEGLITQVAAIGSWFLIIDFPDKARKKGFLSANEAQYIQYRIEKDRGDSVPDHLTWAKFGKHLLDLKLWVFALIFMATSAPGYGFAFFYPVLLRNMGYSPGVSSLLTAPPAISAVIYSYIISYLADKHKIRAPVVAVNCIITIAGLMLTAHFEGNGVRYFGMFLGLGGCQGNVPTILAYQSNNIRLQSKRAVGSALQIGFGAIGGIMASTIFRQEDAPKYTNGLWATAGLQIFIIVASGTMSWYFWRKNKDADLGIAKAPIEGLESFRYTI